MAKIEKGIPDWGLSKLDTVSGFRTSFKGSNILRDGGSVFAVKGLKEGGKQTSRLTAMSVAAEFKEDADSLQTQILSEGMAADTCG